MTDSLIYTKEWKTLLKEKNNNAKIAQRKTIVKIINLFN